MTATQPVINPGYEESTGQKIERWIREAFEANNADMSGVQWEWNATFTARMGDANYVLKRIRLSSPLWPRASEQERENTVKHEACHIITRMQYGYSVKSHGLEWRATMRNCGLKAARCHRVDRTGLARRARRYPATCNCGHVNRSGVGPTVYRRLHQGVRYTCARCHSHIVVI